MPVKSCSFAAPSRESARRYAGKRADITLVRANARATLEVAMKSSLATVRVTPSTKTGEYEIDITPRPNLVVGPFWFDVPLVVVSPDGDRRRCAAIEVSGEMRPSTRIVPDVVLLGEHPVGGEATAEVSVRLPAGPGWAVDRVEGSPDTTLMPNGSSEDGALRYRLVQRIKGPGDKVVKAKILVSKPGHDLESVDLTVRYYSVADKIR